MTTRSRHGLNPPDKPPRRSASIEQDLALLREKIRHEATETVLINSIDRAEEGLATLRDEHHGMTEELLSVYEQLGMVFGVTRAFRHLRDEREVWHMLHQTLARSLYNFQVRLYIGTATCPQRAYGEPLPQDVECFDLLQRAHDDRRVIVEPLESRCSGAAEILVAPIHVGDAPLGAVVVTRVAGAPVFRASDMAIVESLSRFCGDLARNHRLLGELRTMSVSMVRSLVNAVDQKDRYTAGHSTRVAYYATMLGTNLEFEDLDQRMLQWSALLHDVGKIGIRDDVLKKDGALTEEEFEHMKEHPTRSFEVVKGVPHLAGALDGVLYHHEHYDGKGYPKGLSGEDIPYQARVIQVADVFDALTSTRSYRKAFGWQKALSIMANESGTTLDPALQKTFDTIIRGMLENGARSWADLLSEAGAFTHVWENHFGGDTGA